MFDISLKYQYFMEACQRFRIFIEFAFSGFRFVDSSAIA